MPRATCSQALNTALFTDGAYVHIPAGVSVDVLVHIVYVTNAEAANACHLPAHASRARAACRAHPGRRATSRWVTPHTSPTVSRSCEVSDGAQLTHIRVQRESHSSYHVGASSRSSPGAGQPLMPRFRYRQAPYFRERTFIAPGRGRGRSHPRWSVPRRWHATR